MSLKDRLAYQRKKVRLIAMIREEVLQCGLTDVQIRIDDGRPEATYGNHKVQIRSQARGTIEFDIATAWFDSVDSRNEGNLRFAARQAVKTLPG